MKINENFLKVPESYLFTDIGRRIAAYKQAHPEADIIRLGIGDITRPLPAACVEAMRLAADEMGTEQGFRGYPPEYGQPFLVDKITQYDYAARGVQIDPDEVFVSDGAKSDTGNIGDIFDRDNIVAVCDPVYPVYADTNAMAGRAGEPGPDGRWSRLVYLPCTAENDFLPELPEKRPDLIYLCFPNNPTGASISKARLAKWVDYANANGSVILFDAAYEAYITGDSPHSIYEIEGAKRCAVEFRSFSKTAGFTGVRCAFTVVPKQLKAGGVSLNKLWARRQATKFNGVSYVTQRAAEAVYSEQGRAQVIANIEYCRRNAAVIAGALRETGFRVWGAKDSPYIWMQTPDSMKSWDFFDLLLDQARVAGTPGCGFGPGGEGYFRLTAFGEAGRTLEATERIRRVFSK